MKHLHLALPALLVLTITACTAPAAPPAPPAASPPASPASSPASPPSSPASPAAPRMITNDGHRLAFYVTPGKRPAIVLDSGGGEDHTQWKDIAPRLHAATGAQIITYDRAGMGASDEVPGPWNRQNAVSDLEAGLRELGVTGKVILVSHSQAGEIATALAGKNPGLLSGAVLVDANLPQFFTDEETARLVAAMQPQIDAARSAPSTKETRQLLATADGFAESHRAYHRMVWPSSVPATVIRSAKTPFEGSPEDAQRWRDAAATFVKAAPNRTLVTAEGTSHEVPADAPDLVIREIEKMMAAVS
jgi:pimeloyl-ACP methyl ester carboxylesterase